MLLGTLLTALLGHCAYAANKIWNNTGTDFNSPGSWIGGVPGIGDAAVFDVVRVTNPNLSASLTIQQLNFSTAAASGYDLTSSNTSINLTLTNTGTGASSAIESAITSGTNTIDAPIVLGAISGTQTFDQAAGGTLVVNGVVSSTSAIALNLTGGTITLTGSNTYSGGTTVNSGTVFVNNTSGSGTGTGSVSVNNSGTTLGGTGTISGAVTVASGANLSPGATGAGSTGTLHTGALTLSSGSNFNVDVNNTTAGSFDQVSVTGTVIVTGSNIVVTPGVGLTVGDKVFVVLNDGVEAVVGQFAQGMTVTSGLDVFAINYMDNGDSGAAANDISLTVIAIPEPSTWLAATLALGALASTQRRRLRGLLCKPVIRDE